MVYIFLTFYFSSSVYHTITFENTQSSIISMVLISTISIVIALLTVTVSIILGVAFYRMKKKSASTTGTEIMTTTNNPAYAVIEGGDTKNDDYENIGF